MALALRSPLAWPQGASYGINQANPASKSLRMSAVARSDGTMFDLVSSKVGFWSLAAGENSTLGPVAFPATGTSGGIPFPAPISGEVFHACTIACIFQARASLHGQGIVTFDQTTGPGQLSIQASGSIGWGIGGFGAINGLPNAIVGHNYFLVGSLYNTSGKPRTRGLLVDMTTGQIYIGDGGINNFTTITAGANYSVLTYNPGGATDLTRVAAAMISATPMTAAQQLAWAQDPWSFWYPSKGNNALTLPQKVARGAAGSFIAGAAVTATAGHVTASGNTAAHPTGAAVIATAGHVTVSSGSSIATIKPQTFSPSAFRQLFVRPLGSMPGINQAHPAAKGARLAALAKSDGTMFDLVTNKAGVWSLAAGENGQLGPMAYPATITSGGIPFPAVVSGEVFHSCTIACIFQPRGSAHGQGIVTFDQALGGAQLTVQPDSSIGWGIGGFGAINGLPNAIVGHNYFLVGSLYNTSGKPRTRGLLVDMTTGQIYIGDGGINNFTTITAGANYSVLTYRPGGSCDQGRVAAAMISATPMTAAQQLAWAQDPWSFWFNNERVNPVTIANITRSTGLIAGARVTMVAGSVIIPKTIAITGAAATTAPGALAKATAKALSGAVVTTSAGTLTVSAGIPGSVALVGASVATAPGALTVSSTKALSGAAATTAAGALAKALTASITGASVSTAAGSLASGPLLVVAGAAIATAAGALTVSSAKALSGAAATTAAGALAKSSVLGISGASAAVNPGQPSQLVSASVSGAASTVAAGSVKGLTATSISGASIATAPGSVTESSTKTLIGAGTTTVAGQVSASITTSINGASAGTAAGALTKSTSWPAPGASVSTVAGSTTESITAKVTGASITATANPLTSSIIQPVLVTISGASIAAFVGNVVVLAQTYINGINEGRSLGLDWQSANAALTVGVA